MITKTEITIIVLGVILMATSIGTWKLTKDYFVSKYDAQIAEEQLKTQKRITQLTEQKLEAERKLGDHRNELDKDYNKKIKELNTRVDTLKRDNVRLRDPGFKPSGSCPATNPGSTSSDPRGERLAESGALSEQASRFLFDFAAEADGTLEQLRVCRAWVDEVKKTINAYGEKQTKDAASRKAKDEKKKK